MSDTYNICIVSRILFNMLICHSILWYRDKQEAKARQIRNRIHHKIVATNQMMQQQSEENCISEYIRDYMHTMNT